MTSGEKISEQQDEAGTPDTGFSGEKKGLGKDEANTMPFELHENADVADKGNEEEKGKALDESYSSDDDVQKIEGDSGSDNE